MLTRREIVSRIAAGGVAIAMMPGLYACAGGTSTGPSVSESVGNSNGNSAGEAGNQNSSGAATASDNDKRQAAVTAAELASPQSEIGVDDYRAMTALAADLSNGRNAGEVVKVYGTVLASSYMGSVSYYVNVEDSDTGAAMSVPFVIDGESPSLLENGKNIIVTGKVSQDDKGAWVLETLPEYVQVL